jgi:heme/copper-type cytochrome/quinol oxidase subunit 4
MHRATETDEFAWRRSSPSVTAELCSFKGDFMRYVVAWILGVPLSVIALWYVVGHAACGR